MKPYGQRHKKNGPCQCEICGRHWKLALKRRERQKAKKEIENEIPGPEKK